MCISSGVCTQCTQARVRARACVHVHGGGVRREDSQARSCSKFAEQVLHHTGSHTAQPHAGFFLFNRHAFYCAVRRLLPFLLLRFEACGTQKVRVPARFTGRQRAATCPPDSASFPGTNDSWENPMASARRCKTCRSAVDRPLAVVVVLVG